MQKLGNCFYGACIRGASYINSSKSQEALSDRFVTEKAPRTAVVVHKNGTLSLMQVDGEEDIATGLDLIEFSEVLVELGAWHAIVSPSNT